jgi:spermidine/putrescine transport system permease protein
MRIYAAVIYFFLYAPIGMLMLFSFSAGHQASTFEGFSTQWYGTAAGNRFLIEAATNSLSIAALSAILAAVIGTMAALALPQVRGTPRKLYEGAIQVALMIPGIVIAIATLIMLATILAGANDLLLALFPEAQKLKLGFWSIVAAHTLFNIALVIVIVRARMAGMDRALIEASADLYATPLGTFRQVTLPLILPAIVAGGLLSFTFSFDDYIIASFVNGSEITLPLFIFNSIRRGLTPEVNAVATVVFVAGTLVQRAIPAPSRREAENQIRISLRLLTSPPWMPA